MITLTVNIGGTKISAVLTSNDDSFLLRKQISTPHEGRPGEVTKTLRLLVSEMKGAAERFTIASTGIINNRILTALNLDSLGGLEEYPLKNIVEDITGLSGSVINDAQATTWIEHTVLPKEICDMVFIIISTGIGGGIVVNEKLLIGISGLAGHVGHILSEITDTECKYGRRGCVEAISSGRAIMGTTKNKLAEYSARCVFELVRQGYKETEFLTERSANITAELIVSLESLLDCQVVVVRGGVGLVDEYVQKVSKHLSIYSKICNVMLLPAYFRSDSDLISAILWDRDYIT